MFTNLLVAALACLLGAAAFTDLRGRLIEHWTVIAIAALAPLFWIAQGYTLWPDIAAQLGLALAVFGVFAALWALGAIGGGDVKLLGALALWLPLAPLFTMLVAMALAGAAIATIMLVAHKFRRNSETPEVPYGLAIAIGGVWAICQPHLNQFA